MDTPVESYDPLIVAVLIASIGERIIGAFVAHRRRHFAIGKEGRPDALFTDPWAAQLAGEGAAWLSRQSSDAGLTPALRTRFLDDLMSPCLQQTTIRQVVLVGAGLDMRAYRMAWPEDARLFEIDQACVLAYKEHVLAPLQFVPHCQRIRVPADLTETWADLLVQAGFQTHHRALWIVEVGSVST